MMQMFDKQLTLRMGQANVRRWVDDILPLLSGDDDPLGVEGFATHHVPLDEAPEAYEMFQKKAGRRLQGRVPALIRDRPAARSEHDGDGTRHGRAMPARGPGSSLVGVSQMHASRLIRQSIARLRDDADHSASATFDLATRTIGRTPGATAPLRSSGHAVATAIWSTGRR